MLEGAPATLRLIAACDVGAMLVSMAGSQYLFQLAIDPYLSSWHQYRRCILDGLIWTDQSKVILGTLALYNLRVVEQMLGSRRFTRVILGSWVLSTLALPIVLGGLSIAGINWTIFSGPTAIVGAAAALYHKLVPPSYCISFPGIGVISNKLLVYFVIAQMVRGPGDIIKLALGWFSSKLIFRKTIG